MREEQTRSSVMCMPPQRPRPPSRPCVPPGPMPRPICPIQPIETACTDLEKELIKVTKREARYNHGKMSCPPRAGHPHLGHPQVQVSFSTCNMQQAVDVLHQTSCYIALPFRPLDVGSEHCRGALQLVNNEVLEKNTNKVGVIDL